MAGPKKKILVVDDDQLLRELAVEVLSGEFEVRQASDGQEAMELALHWRPDLVITDIMMPGMHGHELCGRLKGRGGLPGVKVLFASTKTFSTDISQSLAAGGDDYLVKPYLPDNMLGKVRALLGLEGSSAPAPAAPELEMQKTFRGMAPEPEPVAHAASGTLPVYVRFWGTRGSCPTTSPGVAGYGGNTPCTELRVGETPVIFDCGTGLRELGDSLMSEFQGRPLQGYVLVGHTHWDHIQGFPFFLPFRVQGNRFTIFSAYGANGSLGRIFTQSMSLDYFPVPLSSIGAKLGFAETKGTVDIGVAKVSFRHLNHPGVCIGFRVEAQGRVITYISDHEPFCRQNGDSELARRQDSEIAAFARGSDLLIREAQYTEAEYQSRRGWGHATYDDAARLALASGARRMAVTHHDPYRTDAELDENIDRCCRLISEGGGVTECFGAREGLRIDL